jgi:hypothetical protein
MKRPRTWLTTLVLTAVIIVLFAGVRSQYPHFLARHWQKQLATIPDDRAEVLLEGACQLGEPGIPVLVEAMGQEREEVAESGKRAIWREISRWRTLRARDYSPKLAILAKALADRVGQFRPAARAEAVRLATQILKWWTLDDEVVDPAEVIASCETVLRVAAQRGALADRRQFGPFQEARESEARPPVSRVPTGGTASLPGGAFGAAGSSEHYWTSQQCRPPAHSLPEPGAPLRHIARIPGGGLPIKASAGPPGPTSRDDSPQLAAADPHEPPRLGTNNVSEAPLRPDRETRAEPAGRPARIARAGSGRRLGQETGHGAVGVTPEPAGLSEGGGTEAVEPPAPPALSDGVQADRIHAVRRRLDQINRVTTKSPDSSSAPDILPETSSARSRLAGIGTVELMRRLHSKDGRAVLEAERELACRGFGPLDLELARQMFHPDPKRRMELVRLLPLVPNVDAVPWLLELSRDENAEVRQSAIALLATTGDPELLRLMETTARGDSDPRVQRQAERIAGREGTPTY